MHWSGVAFGIALALAAAAAAQARKEPERPGRMSERELSTLCVGLLGIGWALAVITAPIAVQYPEALLSWAALDTVCGTVVVLLWVRHLKPWLILLGMLYFGQCFLHVQYWTGSIPEMRVYQLWVNLLLVAQIWCAAWPGAENVAVRVLDRVLPAPRRSSSRRVAKGHD